MHNRKGSQRLVGEMQMFRLRVATAESKLKMLRDEALQAKRRRKETKRMAQRARKQFKLFKADVAELRRSLAKAERKLLQAGGRAMARKMAKARPVVSRGARSLKKPKAVVRKPTQAARRAVQVPRKVAKTAAKETNPVAQIPASVSAPNHTTPAP